MISDYLKNYKVLLASGSKRRHQLLEGLEIKFKILKLIQMIQILGGKSEEMKLAHVDQIKNLRIVTEKIKP